MEPNGTPLLKFRPLSEDAAPSDARGKKPSEIEAPPSLRPFAEAQSVPKSYWKNLSYIDWGLSRVYGASGIHAFRGVRLNFGELRAIFPRPEQGRRELPTHGDCVLEQALRWIVTGDVPLDCVADEERVGYPSMIGGERGTSYPATIGEGFLQPLPKFLPAARRLVCALYDGTLTACGMEWAPTRNATGSRDASISLPQEGQAAAPRPKTLWEFAKRVCPCRVAAYNRAFDIKPTTLPLARFERVEAEVDRTWAHLEAWNIRLINKHEEARQCEAESLRLWARSTLLQSIELRVRDALTSGRYKVTGIGQDGRRVEIDRLDVAAMTPRFHEGVNALASPTRCFDDVVVEDVTVLPEPVVLEAPVDGGADEVAFVRWAQEIKDTHGCWPPEMSMRRRNDVPAWRRWAKDRGILCETVREWAKKRNMRNPRGSPPAS